MMVRLHIRCSIEVSLQPPEVGLVEKLSGSLHWWVELYVPTLHRECTYIFSGFFLLWFVIHLCVLGF